MGSVLLSDLEFACENAFVRESVEAACLLTMINSFVFNQIDTQ